MTTQPQWIEKFLNLYRSGIAHSFIVHFNINDYVSAEGLTSSITYLSKILASRIVVIYSRDKGITFATESMKKKALEILELGQEQPAQALSPALAALQSIGAAAPAQEQELPRNPAAALPLLDQLLRYIPKRNEELASGQLLTGVAVIIENTEFIIPDASLAMMPADDRTALATIARWGRDSEIVNTGNIAILMTGNIASVHSDLRAASNRYEAIEIGLPGTEQRQTFIEQYIDRKEEEGVEIRLVDDLTVSQIANSTAGLSLVQIEDILLRAIREGQLTRSLVWDRKRDIIKGEFGDVLEVIEPRLGFEDIGGLDYVKDFFFRSVIRPIQKGRTERVPMGVLLLGPAGTGKSVFAEAVAKEAGINVLKLNVGGQIASKWQGEGERNIVKALTAISVFSPSIVFIDEIDQVLKRGDGAGGSQQDNRIFQIIMEYMADTSHRGRIIFLAATNRPDLMDAALRRPGRLDKKIPFLVPDEKEREAIFKIAARKHLGQECEIPQEAIKASEGWTGAEIIAAGVKAAELAEDYEMDTCQAIEEAVKRLRPTTADIQLMTLLAVRECEDRDLLPPKYRQMKEDSSGLDNEIISLKNREEGTRKQRNL